MENPVAQEIDHADLSDLKRVVRRASRSIALVGFPNSGKTAYLTALGKELQGPQDNALWKIVGSHEDIFLHVGSLLLHKQDGDTWKATYETLAPKPINLFRARRKGIWHCRTSAFDTSGEHYLGIAGGRELAYRESQYYASVLQKDVLPKCPGIVAMFDCSLSSGRVAEHVSYYNVLLNRIHGSHFFEEGEAPPQQMGKASPARPLWHRIPVALTLTKVDLLEGRRIQVRTNQCAYLEYLRSKGRDPVAAGLRGTDSHVVSYTVRTEVFLDCEKFPDPAEGEAVIWDYVTCCMRPLANMIENLKASDRYEVRLFPVSAWGRMLRQDEQGVEYRPDIDEIKPARIMESLFWILERIYRTRRERALARVARSVFWLVALLMLLGPGLFWGLYAGGKHLLEKGNTRWACNVLIVEGYHPFTRYVQRYWEPQAQQKLIDLNFKVIKELIDSGDLARARSLADLSRELDGDTTAIDTLELRIQRTLFDKAMTGSALSEAWREARRWFDINYKRIKEKDDDRVTQPERAALEEAVRHVADRLIQASGEADFATLCERDFDPKMLGSRWFSNSIWTEFATWCQQRGAGHAGRSEFFLASVAVSAALADLGDDGPAVELWRKADGHARQSGCRGLMRFVHSKWVESNKEVLDGIMKHAIAEADGGEFQKALQSWDESLRVGRRCPSLIRPIIAFSVALKDRLAEIADQIEAESGHKNVDQIVGALTAAWKIADEVGQVEPVVVPGEVGLKLVRMLLKKGTLATSDSSGGAIAREAIDEARVVLARCKGKWGLPDKLPPPGVRELVLELADRRVMTYEAAKNFGVTLQEIIRFRVAKLIGEANYGEALALIEEAVGQNMPVKTELKAVLNGLEKQFLIPKRPTDLRDNLDKLAVVAGQLEMKAEVQRAKQLIEHAKITEQMVLVHKDKVAFYVDPTEVTNSQYRKFWEAKGGPEEHRPQYEHPLVRGRLVKWPDEAFWEFTSKEDIPNTPIVGVSYVDAQAYARWCGKRLLTPEEYRDVAQGLGGLGLKSLGAPRPEEVNVNDTRTYSAPVGAHEKDKTPEGVSDVCGNVREWCGPERDGRATAFGLSWFDGWSDDWAANPFWRDKTERNHFTGFRCAVGLLPPKKAEP